MTDTHEAELVEPLPRVVSLRTALPPAEAKVLHDLSDNASEVEIMRRLLEMGPTLEDDRKETGNELKTFTVASKFMSPEHGEVLLQKVRRHAYNPQSPLRTAALQLLAENGDASANQILKMEEEQRQKERLAKTQQGITTQIRGCCDG